MTVRAGCDWALSEPAGDPLATDERRGLRRKSGSAVAVDGDGGLVLAPGTPAMPTGRYCAG